MSEYETAGMRDATHLLGEVAFFGLAFAAGSWIYNKCTQSKREQIIIEEKQKSKERHEKNLESFWRFAFSQNEEHMNNFNSMFENLIKDPKLLSATFANIWNHSHSDILRIDYRNGFKQNLNIAFEKWKTFSL